MRIYFTGIFLLFSAISLAQPSLLENIQGDWLTSGQKRTFTLNKSHDIEQDENTLTFYKVEGTPNLSYAVIETEEGNLLFFSRNDEIATFVLEYSENSLKLMQFDKDGSFIGHTLTMERVTHDKTIQDITKYNALKNLQGHWALTLPGYEGYIFVEFSALQSKLIEINRGQKIQLHPFLTEADATLEFEYYSVTKDGLLALFSGKNEARYFQYSLTNQHGTNILHINALNGRPIMTAAQVEYKAGEEYFVIASRSLTSNVFDKILNPNNPENKKEEYFLGIAKVENSHPRDFTVQATFFQLKSDCQPEERTQVFDMNFRRLITAQDDDSHCNEIRNTLMELKREGFMVSWDEFNCACKK